MIHTRNINRMSTTPRGHVRRVAVTLGLPVVAATAILIFYFAWLPRLPERLATHFGAGM